MFNNRLGWSMYQTLPAVIIANKPQFGLLQRLHALVEVTLASVLYRLSTKDGNIVFISSCSIVFGRNFTFGKEFLLFVLLVNCLWSLTSKDMESV